MLNSNTLTCQQNSAALTAKVKARLDAANFERIINGFQKQFDQYTHNVDSPPVTDLTVTGTAIVGSYITSKFKPTQSDFDCYVIANRGYHDSEGFGHYIRMRGSHFGHWFPGLDEHTVHRPDPLEIISEDQVRNTVNTPAIIIKRTTNPTNGPLRQQGSQYNTQ